jgi:hypothetical protein
LHHIPYQDMVSENNQLSQILKYMINRLWYGIFHITCHINHLPILGTGSFGPWANMDVSGWYMEYEKCHIIIYDYYRQCVLGTVYMGSHYNTETENKNRNRSWFRPLSAAVKASFKNKNMRINIMERYVK